jgi:hypothetical protein
LGRPARREDSRFRTDTERMENREVLVSMMSEIEEAKG